MAAVATVTEPEASVPADDGQDGQAPESTNRATAGKGQSKGEVASLPEDGAQDSEKTGPRPGRHAGAASPSNPTE